MYPTGIHIYTLSLVSVVLVHIQMCIGENKEKNLNRVRVGCLDVLCVNAGGHTTYY